MSKPHLDLVWSRNSCGPAMVILEETAEVGKRRAPARGGHGTHWREGVAQADVSGEET